MIKTSAELKHSWEVSPRQAIQIQERLRAGVILAKGFRELTRIGGADVAYRRENNRLYAVVAVFDYQTMSPLEEAYAKGSAHFPYIPGLLTFREGPVVLEAFRQLRTRPDLILFDGQGIAHPRRMGLATHMGLLLNIPTVGCAKKPLRVQFQTPGLKRGSATRMMAGEEQVGVVVRTRDGVKPVYVSPGHLVDVASSVRVVLATGRGYRLPEPTRLAHLKVTEFKKADPGS